MHNLREYSLWLVLVSINAVIVSQGINHLILMSGEAAGLTAGLFLSIFLGSLMFLLIRSVMALLVQQGREGRLQVNKIVKAVGVA